MCFEGKFKDVFYLEKYVYKILLHESYVLDIKCLDTYRQMHKLERTYCMFYNQLK